MSKKVPRRGYFRKPTPTRSGGPVAPTQMQVPPPPGPAHAPPSAAAKSASELGLVELPKPAVTPPPPPPPVVEKHPDAGFGWRANIPQERIGKEIHATHLPDVHFEEAGDMLRHFEAQYAEARYETGDVSAQLANHDAAQLVAHLSSHLTERRSISQQELDEVNHFYLRRHAQYQEITKGTALATMKPGGHRWERDWSYPGHATDPRLQSPFEAFTCDNFSNQSKLDLMWPQYRRNEMFGRNAQEFPLKQFINDYYVPSEEVFDSTPVEGMNEVEALTAKSDARFKVRREVIERYRQAEQQALLAERSA